MNRFFDIIAAGILLIISVPVLLVAGVAILIETGRPVLFTQERLGRRMAAFRILKLRTMHHAAHGPVDQVAEKTIVGGNDSRVTRVGRVLRSASIDELPQLWNVLKGEMAIVGPRPVLPEQLRAMPRAALVRFDVRPGLTGLAQVRGRRGLSWPDQLAADAEYVRTKSPLVDLRIMARTVWVVITARGLYPGEVKNWREYIKDSPDRKVD